MQSNNGDGSRAAPARGFAALWVILGGMGFASMVSPAEAAPFAYVANSGSNTVSVIDTATIPPSVVATITVGIVPTAVAVTPDGKHAYVTNEVSNNVSVIDTATNTVEAATLAVGSVPLAVAVTPDGKHAYVTNTGSSNVSVIDTATNTVEAATLVAGANPRAVAVTPDGKHAYVANAGDNTVSVIDTATNTVEAATLVVGFGPIAVAVTPDGKHAYVTNEVSNNVSVIDTATNTVEAAMIGLGGFPFAVAVTPDGKHAYVSVTNDNFNVVQVIDTATNKVVATVAVGALPHGIAVTPDGKHAYVANLEAGTVSVIDTANNTVEATTIAVGGAPQGVGIVPPPPGVPFLAFNARLQIDLDRKPNKDRFELESSFTLSSTAPAIHPIVEPVTLQVGTFSITIPPGSFKKREDGVFSFHGVIDGVKLKALIKPTGTLRYAFDAEAKGANLTGTTNPVQVSLTIGGDSGTESVKARISR